MLTDWNACLREKLFIEVDINIPSSDNSELHIISLRAWPLIVKDAT